MRTAMLGVLVVMLGGAAVASAQPGPQQPQPQPPQPYYPPPPPAPYAPSPAPYAPSPYQYQPPPQPQPRQVMLTSDEQDLLQTGEISDLQLLGGGAASIFVGFGVGQAVENRWSDTGWIFTLGEGASIAGLMVGAIDALGDNCSQCGTSNGQVLLIGSVIAFAGFRIGEVVDAIVGPPKHNAQLHELRARIGLPPSPSYSLAPYVVPGTNGGGLAGLSVRF